MRKENLFRNKVTKGLVAALALAMATTMVPVSADAAKANTVTISKGDAKKLADKLSNATSSNKKVVTVTKKGKITAVKKGTATITATNKKGKKVTYKVVVKKAPTISADSVKVKAGNSKKVTVDNKGVKTLSVSFKSANAKVAKVNKNGKITGVKKGSTVVTATVKGFTKTYKLTVDVKVTKAAADDSANTDVETPSTDVEKPSTDTETPSTDDKKDETTEVVTDSAIDTTTDGAVDVTPDTPSTPSAPSTGTPGATVVETRETTASVKMTKETTALTAKIGTQTIVVTKKAVQDYFADTTKPLVFTINGNSTNFIPSDSNAMNATATYGEYTYTVEVSNKTLDTAVVTVTAKIPASVVGELVLTGDMVAVDSETVTIDNTKEAAELTVGNETLEVTKAQAKELALGNSVTVKGVTLTPATTKDAIEGSSAAKDIAAGNVTLGGYKVTLHVIGYTSADLENGGKKHTVTVYATASAPTGTKVTLTAE